MGDRIVPNLRFGTYPGHEPSPPATRPPGPVPDNDDLDDGGRFLRRRELDLRRTPAPDPGALSIQRMPHPRRYAIRTFDDKGRIGDQLLFGALEWHSLMPVSIRVHDSGALMICRDPHGESVLTKRTMVAVPAAILRWCGFDRHEQVLLVAVPSLSSLVIHGQELLDHLLPDPRRIVADAYPAAEGPPESPVLPSGTPGDVEANHHSGVTDD